MFKVPHIYLNSSVWILLSLASGAQISPQSPKGEGATAIRQYLAQLAESGQCKEASARLNQPGAALPVKDVELKDAEAVTGCAIRANQPDLAVDILRILNHDFPLDPQMLYLSVHVYSDLSTLAAQKLITFAPKSLQLLQLEAESLEMEGKVEEAEKKYQALLEQDPRVPTVHYRLGKLLLLAPNPSPATMAQAKRQFELELEIDPTSAGAEYFLGDLARRDGRWPEAIDHFSRATKADPTLADAYLGLGYSLVSTKRFADAIEPLQTATKLNPRDPVAHYNLAVAYGRTGRKQEAEHEFAVHRELTESRADTGTGAVNGIDQTKTLLH